MYLHEIWACHTHLWKVSAFCKFSLKWSLSLIRESSSQNLIVSRQPFLLGLVQYYFHVWIYINARQGQHRSLCCLLLSLICSLKTALMHEMARHVNNFNDRFSIISDTDWFALVDAMFMYCSPIWSLEKSSIRNWSTTWCLSKIIHKTHIYSGASESWTLLSSIGRCPLNRGCIRVFESLACTSAPWVPWNVEE